MTAVARAPIGMPATSFARPPGSEATAPAERRGVERDGVRLLVATDCAITHHRFSDLPAVLRAGDLVVVNTSATLPAALRVWRERDHDALIHVAGSTDDGSWIIEPRRRDNTGPAEDVAVGESILLAGGPRLRVADSYPSRGVSGSRLWRAVPDRPLDLAAHLSDHGLPIRYGAVERWPLDDLQNVYADEPGSAEMPSAGRPLTERVLTRLMVRGIRVAPLVVHTGVSSPEKHEPPIPERFRVPEPTAALVNTTKAEGGRVIAVGTTVVRALETVVAADGAVRAGTGWTEHVVGPASPIRVVDGVISGLHEPEASHLLLLEEVAGRDLVQRAYDEAVRQRYLLHEFGDSMLFLPDCASAEARAA
jgi:S-adenosylmethionine:tRNA ribosyltransferase-isomerase